MITDTSIVRRRNEQELKVGDLVQYESTYSSIEMYHIRMKLEYRIGLVREVRGKNRTALINWVDEDRSDMWIGVQSLKRLSGEQT